MDQFLSAEMDAAVTRGAAWLDRNEPGWADRIDIGTLELTSSSHCVAGQVFGSQAPDGNGYAVMMDKAGHFGPYRTDTHLGFSHLDVDYWQVTDEAEPVGLEKLELLKARWITEIKARTSATVGS